MRGTVPYLIHIYTPRRYPAAKVDPLPITAGVPEVGNCGGPKRNAGVDLENKDIPPDEIPSSGLESYVDLMQTHDPV
jgi:hypothetical protein